MYRAWFIAMLLLAIAALLIFWLFAQKVHMGATHHVPPVTAAQEAAPLYAREGASRIHDVALSGTEQECMVVCGGNGSRKPSLRLSAQQVTQLDRRNEKAVHPTGRHVRQR